MMCRHAIELRNGMIHGVEPSVRQVLATHTEGVVNFEGEPLRLRTGKQRGGDGSGVTPRFSAAC
jgi:hypothetical protein